MTFHEWARGVTEIASAFPGAETFADPILCADSTAFRGGGDVAIDCGVAAGAPILGATWVRGAGYFWDLVRFSDEGLDAVTPFRNASGELTNGNYTVLAESQSKHTTGNLAEGNSQFLFGVDDEALTLRAAERADEYGLWDDQNKAKIFVDQVIGVTGDGTPTQWINVYRRDPGGAVPPYVHASPGNAP